MVIWCWQKSHCSSPIAVKDFRGAVNPLVDPAFAGNFLHFSDKEVPGLQKINLFTLIKYFFSEYTVIHCHLVSNVLEIQSRTRLTFSQSQHSKRLRSVIKHKHFNILISVTICLNSVYFHWLSGSYTSKTDLEKKKECKRFALVIIKTCSFNKCFVRFWITSGITRIYVFRDSFMSICWVDWNSHASIFLIC